MINPISDGKQFCFSRSDIDSMMDYFGQNVLTRADIWNWSRSIVFDTSIRDNNDSFSLHTGIFKDFIEILKVGIHKVFLFAVFYIEKNFIGKIVY